jgi:hypothetical protein
MISNTERSTLSSAHCSLTQEVYVGMHLNIGTPCDSDHIKLLAESAHVQVDTPSAASIIIA